MKLENLIEKYKKLPIQVKASFVFLICAFFQKSISSITTPIFTRLLTTAEYGQYSVFSSWMGILSIIVSMNLWGGVYMQGMVKYDNERQEFSASFQGLTLTLVLVWTAVYLAFRSFWNTLFSLTTVQMLAMFVLIWTTSAFNFWAGEQRVDFKYKKLAILTVAVSIMKPLVGIILVVFTDDKVTARILGLALVELFFFSGCFWQQVKSGRTFFVKKYWLYGVKFNVPLLPHYLSGAILSGADRIMIQNMLGSSEAGIYSLAYSVSLIMTMFNNALFQTVEPWIYKKIKSREIKEIANVAYITFAMIAGVNIFLIAFAPEIIRFFAPVEYYGAIWVIPPIAMSVYFMYVYVFFATFEFFYEKQKYIATATMIGAIVNVILNDSFIGYWGYVAAGYTTLFCYILYALFHYVFMRRICRKELNIEQPYNLKTILMITGMFIGISFALFLTYAYTAVRYILIFLLCFVVAVLRKRILGYVRELISIRKI